MPAEEEPSIEHNEEQRLLPNKVDSASDFNKVLPINLKQEKLNQECELPPITMKRSVVTTNIIYEKKSETPNTS
jgi:hypothetical protein